MLLLPFHFDIIITFLMIYMLYGLIEFELVKETFLFGGAFLLAVLFFDVGFIGLGFNLVDQIWLYMMHLVHGWSLLFFIVLIQALALWSIVVSWCRPVFCNWFLKGLIIKCIVHLLLLMIEKCLMIIKVFSLGSKGLGILSLTLVLSFLIQAL